MRGMKNLTAVIARPNGAPRRVVFIGVPEDQADQLEDALMADDDVRAVTVYERHPDRAPRD